MKKAIVKSFKIISLILFGFLMGSIVGFKAGFYAFYFYDSIPRGTLATSQLKGLNHDDKRAVRLYLESDVNQALYNFSLLDEYSLFSPFVLKLIGYSPKDFQDYVTRVAIFRSRNPDTSFSSTPLDVTSSSSEFEKELAKAQVDRIARINAVVKNRSGS